MAEQESNQAKQLAEQNSALVPYIPKSKAPFRLDTLTPRNMAFEVQKALNHLVKTKGNVDNLVRNQLKYNTTEELWKSLAAEQIDSIALYLEQFDKNQGIIIADQTGIGKGRQAAAVIRHAIKNGYLPIFFTRKPDLFTDLYRDLWNIGMEDVRPFMVNTTSDAKIKDENGQVVFSPLSNSEQYDLLVNERRWPTDSQEAIEYYRKIGKPLPDPDEVPEIIVSDTLDYLPRDYNLILSTYSQIQAAHPYKRLWLAQLTDRGVEGASRYKKVVFILDESHMAGGYESIVGTWMRSVLPSAKSCCYLSATFAKYPEVMPFYAKKTAIAEMQLRDDDFVNAMVRGGLALQEIVASNLSESGQLIRRQRSNEGVKVEYVTLDMEPARSLHRDRVNRVTAIMNRIVDFERNYVTPEMEEIHAEAKELGAQLEAKPRGLGVKQSPYFSRVFNIVDQLLFALKVEDVVAKTIELLNQNKKVVIAFKSTMGTFLKELNLSSGDEIRPEQLDFARSLSKGLESIFSYSYTSIDGKKSRNIIPIENLSWSAQQEYNDILSSIQSESTGLSISPIDELIRLIESTQKSNSIGGHSGSHFKVAEVTGRNQRVCFEDTEEGRFAYAQAFRSDTEKSFRLFNSGEYDVLLINQSGSTGSSAHASSDFKDQRQRAMIIHQFELDINTEVQKRGRINRTGQVVLPEYYYITTDIPAERRLMTMLKAKLKSLDANTTGSQKTSEDTLQSADFLNKYGDQVAFKWISDHPEMMDVLGWPGHHRETDKWGTRWVKNDSNEGAIRQLTGRAGLLSVYEQDELYLDLLRRYDNQVLLEKQQGTYDLETEFLKLDAEIKKRFLFAQGNGGSTPFGKNTVREENIVNNLKRPLTKAELDKRIDARLDGKTPKAEQTFWLDLLEKNYPGIVQTKLENRRLVIETLKSDLKEHEATKIPEDEKLKDRWERKKTKLEELIGEKEGKLSKYAQELEVIKETIEKSLNYWRVGDVVKIRVSGTSEYVPGVFMGVQIAAAKNPWTIGNVLFQFVVADSRIMVRYNLEEEQLDALSHIYLQSQDIGNEERLQILSNWNETIKAASKKREKRHILTENIVGSADQIGTANKLIKFNTVDNQIKNGILMSREYGDDKQSSKALLPISKALGIIKNLSENELFGDHQHRVRFKRIYDDRYKVLIKKGGNFDLFTKDEFRSLIVDESSDNETLPDFVQNGGDMTAELLIVNLERYLLELDKFGLKYLGAARELEDWEVENAEDWQKKTNQSGDFAYRLLKLYGDASNPVSGFIEYYEKDKIPEQWHIPSGIDTSNGIVVYGRALSDSERYNFSLVPVFRNSEEPYLQWKEYIEQSVEQKAWKELIEQSKNTPLFEAILNLGYFIANNPHQDGNHEFVFGDYSPLVLGKVAYEDQVRLLSSIDQIILQLQISINTEI